MSVALDLDSLFAPSPVAMPAQRPRLRVVTGDPMPGDGARPGTGAPLARSLVQPERVASVSVLHAPSSAALAAPLRLTRRGVVVLAVLTAALGALLVWVAALSASGGAHAGSAAGRAGAGPVTVTVHSGDTLWALAGRVAPGRDPLAEVAELRRLNHLSDPALAPGQVLRVR